VATVTIHRLTGSKKAHEACRLVETLFGSGRRVIAWVSDAGRAATFNEYLWTFAQHSFVPHGLSDGSGESDDPVAVVTGLLANVNGADTLVIVDTLPEFAHAREFAEVHDFVTMAPEDAERVAAWEREGFTVAEASPSSQVHARGEGK
jgi:DNA polymerase IIIc chi subunit